MRVAVGSLNKIKVEAVAEAVAKAFGSAATVDGIESASQVAEQPWGDHQTRAGAENRARACRSAVGADIGVGIEAGLVELADGAIESLSWVVAVGQGTAGDQRRGQSRATTYLLPTELADLVRRGATLGEATRKLFTEQPIGAGTVGPLTNGRIDRRGHYAAATTLALIPFYPSNSGLTFAS